MSKDDENDENDQNGRYRLTARLDASHLEEQREKRPQDLRIVGRLADGTLRTATVELDDGEGTGELSFETRPGDVGVFFGPADLTPEELVRTQTLTENVPEGRWEETTTVELEPVRIPGYYWDWWHRWCRTFVVRGQLTCPDGSPVPGAEVCAKDVDSWFYWRSTDQVGCDTTDENGTFEIEFRWCCGFRPRWWWQNRAWRPDEGLIDRIQAATSEVPALSLARGGTQPGLGVFEDLLEDRPVPGDRPLPELDPDQLERVRAELVERLPEVPDLRRLGVWPWAPWQPWVDCTPDLIFEATQAGNVVLEEDIGDTRWDVSTTEDVRLTANEKARCRGGCRDPPCPGGECLLVTGVCNADIDRVGGNFGAPATPEGYMNPRLSSAVSGGRANDRPFAGGVSLWRSPAMIRNIDYLEFEYDDGTGWDPVPHDGVDGFTIGYMRWQSGSWTFPEASFGFTDIDGHWVVETREHYEDTHTPVWSDEKARRGGAVGSVDAWWDGHEQNRLVVIDSTAFSDGTYSFRIVGYEDVGPDDEVELERRGVVTRCPEEEETPVEVTLTFDNRTRVPLASHPHPTTPITPGSGTGSVHRPYVEPDTSIDAVRLVDGDGNVVDVPTDEGGECPSIEKPKETNDDEEKDDLKLRIDFIARDPVGPDNPVGHLADYTMRATFGRSGERNLLDQPTSTVTARGSGYTGYDNASGSGSGPGQDRGEYGRALAQGATQPEWAGGEYRLEVALDEAFPKQCCYQLELRARKRTVANCNHDHAHWNVSEYSIGYGLTTR